MKRSDFLKIIGASSLIGIVGLPSIHEVDAFMNAKSDIKPEKDPFSHIRQLMKEAAKPDWEYHFSVTKERFPMEQYTVFLFQNENVHRETVVFPDDLKLGFNERAQRDMFHRLMYGVNQFNALSQDKRSEIKQIMSQYGKV